jgi:hypothetical protein
MYIKVALSCAAFFLFSRSHAGALRAPPARRGTQTTAPATGCRGICPWQADNKTKPTASAVGFYLFLSVYILFYLALSAFIYSIGGKSKDCFD